MSLSPKNKIAIVFAPFYQKVTDGLIHGAESFLYENGVTPKQVEKFEAAGAFEIPLLAKTLASTRKYAGVICLGAVVKGETAHFEYISSATSYGLMEVTLQTEIPVSFGILTTYTLEQAEKRSLYIEHNKGVEAARACWNSIKALEQIQKK